jgi:hypothetical protein
MRAIVAVFLLLAPSAVAHVGSPDVFYEGVAGPYRLLVTIRPPVVVPGIAEVEVRSTTTDVTNIRMVPLRLQGPGAKLAPTPDVAQRSAQDPQFFTGGLWLMAPGEWKVRVEAAGNRGKGELSVPVPAVALRSRGMQTALGTLLFSLMVLLALGAISIVGAGVREAQVEPGTRPARPQQRRAFASMMLAAIAVVYLLYLGSRWWDSEAGNYGRNVYKPLRLSASVENGGRLLLHITDPGWLSWRKLDDLLPDHGHLMHLYLIGMPQMDRVWHLHPEQLESGAFVQQLPDMQPGRYQVFADIVHATGFAETVAEQIELPSVHGKPLQGDDSFGSGPALTTSPQTTTVAAELPGGKRMIRESSGSSLRARALHLFRFRLEDADGTPLELEPYMGMAGHAAFVSTDLSVFAHIHPSGSVPMPVLSLAGPTDPHAAHPAAMSGAPAEVSFPYGFPKAGAYRIFVQVKHAGRVETGIFDTRVDP